jgi:catechol 2,3-dioxygenase-like lactoylglutathione lyase family enzyme
VRATRINHVSIAARDLEESSRVYEEVFGLERLPSPNFGMPVSWFRIGDTQLHLFQSDMQITGTQHLGIEVDDFERVYRRLLELGMFERDGYFARMVELPEGAVQLYFRDPSGNLVEVDHPDVTNLDRSLFGDRLVRLADLEPQSDENLRARLWAPPTPRTGG